jgi:hypothetical protein
LTISRIISLYLISGWSGNAEVFSSLLSDLKRAQGNLEQSKQYLPFRSWQILILQKTRVLGLFLSASLQPWHLFFSRKYAMQIPQCIPQGAIRFLLILSTI